MRRSTYTCRRCLQALKPTSTPRDTLNRQTCSIASSGNPPSRPADRPKHPHPSNTSRPARRTASSLETQTLQKDDSFVDSLGYASANTERALLRPDNLFHSFTNSPSPGIRKRAAFMRQHAYCPHPSHQRTRQPIAPNDPENRKPMPSKETNMTASPPAHVRFECPDCGIPVACCEDHWAEDYESHMEICDTLRQINEDDHDLHSGRFFPEFDYPGAQRAEEFIINMSNWDTFLYTRDFPAINEDRSLRQVTQMLTYPMTITSVLHELSPYNMRQGGRLTKEGLRSFSASRYMLHPPRMGQGGDTISTLRPKPPNQRLFILGARAESSLPRAVLNQITHCFPRVTFEIIFIGPEAMAGREAEFPLPERTPRNPFGAIVEDRISHELKVSTYVDYFNTMYEAQHFQPFDPYFDTFILFHPGLGHPASSHEWESTIPQLLETKCPIICTGYTEWDMERDRQWVEEKVGGEMDVLLEPGENKFRSLRWRINDLDPADIHCPNWGVWSFRGKRYEALNQDL